jgi:hypothetical protein
LRDVLIVLNPRRIPACLHAINSLNIDKLWLHRFSERQIAEMWQEQVWPRIQPYDRAFLISDDTLPRQHALDAVRSLLDDGHRVATGYSNLANNDLRVNLTREPLGPILGEQAYDFYTMPEVQAWTATHGRTWFAGFSLTGMATHMWQRFPYRTANGDSAADYSLSQRLTQAGVPIQAHRDALIWHLKERWNRPDENPDKRLLVGVEPSDIRHETCA